LGLALILQSQELLRDDLRLLVMSATIEAGPVSGLLGDAPVIASEGRSYPVETLYARRKPEGRIEAAVAEAVVDMLGSSEGDLLVFLPGTPEIRRVAARLQERKLGPGVKVAQLHSSLPQEEQDEAIVPAVDGVRKIVLSTSIAETSLTVQGVRVVIDSGLMRVQRFSPRTGMSRLETLPVSRASADQRRGRAGRLEAGLCYRLWTEEEHRALAPSSMPDIMQSDLSPVALELAGWGVSDPAELRWLDVPPAAAYEQAQQLLMQLGALSPERGITPHGRMMAETGLHPRLAHMLLLAAPLGLGELACTLAALLGERDLLRGPAAGRMSADADIRLRLAAVRSSGAGGAESGAAVDAAACRRVLAEAARLQRLPQLAKLRAQAAPPGAGLGEAEACGVLLAFAYPDRIAQRRGQDRFLLRSGRGAALPHTQLLSMEPYIVAAELDDQGADSRIHLAAPLGEAELERFFRSQMTDESSVQWDRSSQTVKARKQLRLGSLLIRDVPDPQPDRDECTAALMHGISQEGIGILPWSKATRQLQQRMQFMHRFDRSAAAQWPDMADEALLETLPDWLAPHTGGVRSRGGLQQLQLAAILESLLTWEQRRELDAHAPTHLTVPSGSRIPVDYSEPESPMLAVRLQELFGLTETPRIAKGRVPVTIHLLSPAQRPVQVTKDLASFWKSAYFEVKKDLKGRYPKHYWPDNPLEAMPTNRAKPRV
jgi:ATP-dependent helicase HrpB